MSSHYSNKRIAVNTIFMYIKLAITLVIGLFSSRIVLQVLGVSDYGLFNVVGGIMLILTFMRGSLATASTRFFNTEMGNPNGSLNRIFNIILFLHIILIFIIAIFAETIGLWYVLNKLSIEPGKLEDAVFVYQVAVVSSCLSILSTPFLSVFTAYEKFSFIIGWDIFNSFFQFLSIVLLFFWHSDYALRVYSLIIAFSTIDLVLIYYYYAKKNYSSIIKPKFVKSLHYYKEVLFFCNWNLLRTGAIMARTTGIDIIINLFYGTAVNGAYAISKTVNNFITQFSASFDGAAGPQIVQSYSAGDMTRCTYLVNKLGRFCFLLFELIFFPVFIELNFLLKLWLGQVPEGALEFCQVNLFIVAWGLMGGGLNQLINASGKIKWFNIQQSICFLICIPLGYVLCSIGYPSIVLLYLSLFADIIQRIIQFVLLRKIIGFNSIKYIINAYSRPVIIAVISYSLMFIYWSFGFRENIIKMLSIVGIAIFVTILICTIGLTSNERKKIFSVVISKIMI